MPSIALRNATLRLPLAGLGTVTIKSYRVRDAVAAFIQKGGRLLDTAAMYNNYAEIRLGLEASGVLDLSDLIITGKVMPFGHREVRAAILDALQALGRSQLEIGMLHWPGDISSGKLLHGKPLPPCAEVIGDSVFWRRCREASYDALLELQSEGLIQVLGVSNFA